MEQTPLRRKLLQGSLAAPLVLTVASPSALAATSFGACIARIADQPQPGPDRIWSIEPDDMFRRQETIYAGTLNLPGPKVEKNFYMIADRYFPVDACHTAGYAAGDFLKSGKPTAKYKRWALVYVYEDGAAANFGPCKPANSYAVTTSCWASFNTG
jgi:hypothetical protein